MSSLHWQPAVVSSVCWLDANLSTLPGAMAGRMYRPSVTRDRVRGPVRADGWAAPDHMSAFFDDGLTGED